MDQFSELHLLKHVLGPEESDRRLLRRRKAPIWLAPLVAVFVLYGITFAIGIVVSNDAERRFAARGDPEPVVSAPAHIVEEIR